MTITIRQVAREANTSPATVSRVLNNTAGVSPHVRAQVLEVVERLRYQPNRMARALVTNRTAMLGLIVADVANPFFPELVKGAEHAAYAQNYTVLLANTEESDEHEYGLIDLLHRQVDALIIAGSRLSDSALCEVIDTVRVTTPVILVNRVLPGSSVPAVFTRSTGAIEDGVRHLLEQGHTRIAFVGGPHNSWSNHERTASYLRAANLFGLEPILLHAQHPSIDSGSGIADAVLAQGEARPTGLLVYNDLLATGMLRAFLRMGISVPDEIGVIGFDDIALAALIEPPLSSIEQPKYELGQTAVKLAMAQLDQSGETPNNVALAARLIVRRSSQRIPPDRGALSQPAT